MVIIIESPGMFPQYQHLEHELTDRNDINAVIDVSYSKCYPIEKNTVILSSRIIVHTDTDYQRDNKLIPIKLNIVIEF